MKAAPSVVLLVTAWVSVAMGQDVRAVRTGHAAVQPPWDWATASPQSQAMAAVRLEAAWANLRSRNTTAFLVIRNDRIVFEKYAPGYSRIKPHGTASLAKALVGGVALMIAMEDARIGVDDPAWKYVPQWRSDPQRKKITVRHLATHTSGIEDTEADAVPHTRLTGWKGDFWKRLPPPNDPFTIARDLAPVLDVPGTKERYSNPGMAMLGYCISASLRGTKDTDLQSLLKRRIMGRLGVPDGEWSVGYGTTFRVDGLPLVATWGGGAYSPNALARVGRLMLHKGNWDGKQLVSPSAAQTATKPSGMPGHSGLGWWVNAVSNGSKLWRSAPEDAFGGAGAGQQLLLVVPSLDLIVVRSGEQLDEKLSFWEGLEEHVVAPVMQAFGTDHAAYPPSPVIKGIDWAPKETIVRKAQDSDNAYNPADRMLLARVPKDRITKREAYEFLMGLSETGSPLWTSDIAQRKAVFTQPGNCYRSAVSYSPGLKRYLWCQTLPGGDARFHGGFGIYDAPEPWGPSTTAYYTKTWNVGPGETSGFPTKWMSTDGRTLYLVFSGEDYFSVRRTTLTVAE
jgi:CubicO group peptidase (beta-lactamase class C family)